MDEFVEIQSAHFDKIADKVDRFQAKNRYFHLLFRKFILGIVPEGKTVIEIGCGIGHLLNLIKPGVGVGIDISDRMIQLAKKKYPHLEFIRADFKEFSINKQFDFFILFHSVDYFEDVGVYLEKIKLLCNSFSRIIITNFNPLWSSLIRLSAQLGWKTPMPPNYNFITLRDLENFLELHGFEITAQGFRIFLPFKIPLVSGILNTIIPRLPLLRHFCLIQYSVARPKQSSSLPQYSCSVVIPCYNEAENILTCIQRIPMMGTSTEIIVVDDGSTDGTADVVRRISKMNHNVYLITHTSNRGKGQAVKTGFDKARGDILMIIDADMTVPPEELPKFFRALQEGHAEFINGTRMVYPMENQAMKLLNFIGNKWFGILLSLIMEQRNTDVLCGTKAFFKKDYPAFNMKGEAWGDFELLFSASRLKLKMAEVPIHYKERKAGQSKMHALRHGWQLLQNCYRGLKEIP